MKKQNIPIIIVLLGLLIGLSMNIYFTYRINAIDTTQEADKPVIHAIDDSITTPKLTADERNILAALVYLENRSGGIEGMKDVATVVKNRMDSDKFPNTVQDVVFQTNQFATAKDIPNTIADGWAYWAVDEVFECGAVSLPPNVLFFCTPSIPPSHIARNLYLVEKRNGHCYYGQN